MIAVKSFRSELNVAIACDDYTHNTSIYTDTKDPPISISFTVHTQRNLSATMPLYTIDHPPTLSLIDDTSE